MSRETPGKIVSKRQYLVLNGKRLGWYGYGVLLAVALMGALAYGGAVDLMRWRHGAPFHRLPSVMWILLLVSYGVKASRDALRRARAIPVVQPLTDRNAHLLPPQESLVRGSEAPQTESQDMLLRAAQKGAETPPEQLLRAGRGGAE